MTDPKTSPKHLAAYKEAVANGCEPRWFDGILGPAWHCDCPVQVGDIHFIDSQCSVVKWYRSEKGQ